jgi:hypothetical protein
MLEPQPPVPVTALEQAALAVPLRTDVPPATPPVATYWIPGIGKIVVANASPWLLVPKTTSGLPWVGGPALAGLLNPGPAFPSASTCTIDFSDYIALTIIPDKAGYTFASSPFYIEGCGSGWVHIKENDTARYGASWGSSYGHYHLMYEKGPYCVPSGGNFGYQPSGGGCVKVSDPATEPRYLSTHHGDQWIRIYVYKSGVPEMTFDFKSLKVKGTQGIKFYFRQVDGTWLHWNNITPGTWNLSAYTTGIREVLIRSSQGSPNSYSLDNITVAVN